LAPRKAKSNAKKNVASATTRHSGHPQLVDLRHVDLPVLARARVHDGGARREAELHGLLREGEHAGDQRLRRHDRRQRGDEEQRIQRPARREQVERVLHRLRDPQEQRSLAEVVEQQRRKHE
jgi:hypothetical protein